MSKNGPDFYDVDDVFNIYTSHRSRPDSPNNTIEQPLIWNLIGKPLGLDVLDLGLGDSRIAKEFKSRGAKSYTGVEGSKRMFEASAPNLETGFSSVANLRLEEFKAKANGYDLVISSLVFHYVQDLAPLFREIHGSLRQGGRFIFTVEHPVITSCNQSLDKTAVRQAWIVDNYFERGERKINWMGDVVTKYHRTIEDFLNLLTVSGFMLENLKEAEPQKDKFVDEILWNRRRRIPLFLAVAAKKS